jgi:hypothetical protein
MTMPEILFYIGSLIFSAFYVGIILFFAIGFIYCIYQDSRAYHIKWKRERRNFNEWKEEKGY